MEKPTDEKCERCGSPLVLKWGKFGSFFACSTYDKKKKDSCSFTKENFAAKPDWTRRRGRRKRSIVRRAAGSWCCVMGRSVPSWRAPDTTKIRRARRYGG